MDIYHIWCNLGPGITDVAFCAAIDQYLGSLQRDEQICGFRVTRRKLGLGPSDLGEFHIVVEVTDLAQLDRAFQAVSRRSGAIEGLHAAVNQFARDARFALYRDFPDAHREHGEERF